MGGKGFINLIFHIIQMVFGIWGSVNDIVFHQRAFILIEDSF